jgi:hypothetical protein
VEVNLESFRNDLAIVSADIESLQDRSTALNNRLENRQKVEKALGPLVEELSVSPETITKIAEGHVDETWAKMLADIDKRAAAHNKRSAQPEETKASGDLGPLLEKLTLKVRSHGLQLQDSSANQLITGNRAHTRLPGGTDQGIAIATHQCSNNTAAKLSPLSRFIYFPP